LKVTFNECRLSALACIQYEKNMTISAFGLLIVLNLVLIYFTAHSRLLIYGNTMQIPGLPIAVYDQVYCTLIRNQSGTMHLLLVSRPTVDIILNLGQYTC